MNVIHLPHAFPSQFLWCPNKSKGDAEETQWKKSFPQSYRITTIAGDLSLYNNSMHVSYRQRKGPSDWQWGHCRTYFLWTSLVSFASRPILPAGFCARGSSTVTSSTSDFPHTQLILTVGGCLGECFLRTGPASQSRGLGQLSICQGSTQPRACFNLVRVSSRKTEFVSSLVCVPKRQQTSPLYILEQELPPSSQNSPSKPVAPALRNGRVGLKRREAVSRTTVYFLLSSSNGTKQWRRAGDKSHSLFVN